MTREHRRWTLTKRGLTAVCLEGKGWNEKTRRTKWHSNKSESRDWTRCDSTLARLDCWWAGRRGHAKTRRNQSGVKARVRGNYTRAMAERNEGAQALPSPVRARSCTYGVGLARARSQIGRRKRRGGGISDGEGKGGRCAHSGPSARTRLTPARGVKILTVVGQA
jgi:hypothetical protein